MNHDRYYMAMALALAKKGLGKTSPNPMVGAVLVKGSKIVAQGYHKKAGLPHAEAEALSMAGRNAKGSTLYVNLEPCSTFGRTPPCVDSIIREGVKRVVIGGRDPNPTNRGKGIARLRANGIDVICGVLKKDAKELNAAFETYIIKKRPYIILKLAQSIDGKIATYSGHSKWITGVSSRRFVHRLRAAADAVLVGVNTVIKDDPLLSVRVRNTKKELKAIILDSALKTPKKSRLVRKRGCELIIAVAESTPKSSATFFTKMGAELIFLKSKNGMVRLDSLMRQLAKRGIAQLLVEGGGTVAAGFLKEKLVDEVFMFISPKIIGGRSAITSFEGDGVKSVNNAAKLKNVTLKRLGEDILVRGNVCWNN